MVKRTEIYIPIRDLTKLSFSCEDCGAVITVDISQGSQREGIPKETDDKYCPVCNHRIMRSASEVLMALISVWEKATAEEARKNDFHIVISELADETE